MCKSCTENCNRCLGSGCLETCLHSPSGLILEHQKSMKSNIDQGLWAKDHISSVQSDTWLLPPGCPAFVGLSLALSISLYLCLSVPVCVCISICLSLPVFVSLSLSLSLSLSVCLSPSLSSLRMRLPLWVLQQFQLRVLQALFRADGGRLRSHLSL